MDFLLQNLFFGFFEEKIMNETGGMCVEEEGPLLQALENDFFLECACPFEKLVIMSG